MMGYVISRRFPQRILTFDKAGARGVLLRIEIPEV
jgi:hypothetical protein